jgi:hypothetical protein
MTIVSGFFETSVVGPLRVPGQILQWDRDKVNPSGFRHWESGEYKPDAKIGLVGGFAAQRESGNALDFGLVDVVDAGFLTDTIVFTFNLGEVNSHENSFFNQMVAASSVGTNFKAFNMKLWVGDLTAFTASGVPTPIFHMRNSAQWIQGLRISPNNSGVVVVPSSLPISGNIFSRNNNTFISGAYQDLQFSHFIYLVGEFPSGTFPLGTYGGLGDSDFTFKFSYDWTDINANVLATDLLPT